MSWIISSYFSKHQAFSILGVQRAHAEICPTLQVYNCLLKASVQMNSLNHANEVLYLMEQEGMLKDIITYSQLLKVCRILVLYLLASTLQHKHCYIYWIIFLSNIIMLGLLCWDIISLKC